MPELDVLLRSEGVITLAVIENSADAEPLAQALLDGGLGIIEVALRTPESLRAIAHITDSLAKMLVLAGTVLTVSQAEESIGAGARGLVSPGFSQEVSAWCAARNVPYIPGVATASEVMTALDHGHHLLKFFPASSLGGLPTLAALEAPFSHRGVSFMMTGGMRETDLEEALSVPFVSAVGGSWIATKSDVTSGEWEKIAARASSARALVSRLRPGVSRDD